MNINSAFPSTYVKASDLQGRDVTLKIDRVVMEKVGEDTKPVLYFQGTPKGMVLNKTNANRIADMYGFDTDRWLTQSISIFPTECDLRGDIVQCIRVRSHKPSVNGQPMPEPAKVTHEPVNEDEIPF